jgi:hypothetical protein
VTGGDARHGPNLETISIASRVAARRCWVFDRDRNNSTGLQAGSNNF